LSHMRQKVVLPASLPEEPICGFKVKHLSIDALGERRPARVSAVRWIVRMRSRRAELELCAPTKNSATFSRQRCPTHEPGGPIETD
jgi:hypothetical protein